MDTKSVKEIPAGIYERISVTHGYGRCSTNETKQDLTRQVRELKEAGADKVWIEYEHGDAAYKEQQTLMFENCNRGDTVITLEISRLARSTRQLLDIIEIIKQKKLCLIIKNSITLDCRSGQPDPMSEAFLQMAGIFSQLELMMIRARVKSGVENARAKGRKLGRPPKCRDTIPDGFFRYYTMYQRGDICISELARLSELSRPTVYRYIKILEEDA